MNIFHPDKIITGLLLILLCLLIPVVQAQTNNKPRAEISTQWSQVIQSTVERHAEYLLYDSQKQLGEGYQKQSSSWLGGDPSANLLHYSDRFSSDQGYREWEAGVALPLWLPGEKSARQRISAGYFSEAEADLKLLTWSVAGKVQELAWDVYLAEAALKLTYQQWQSSLSLEKNIQRRLQAGELPRSDKLLAQQSSLDREAFYQDAVSQLEQAKNAWQSYTGLTEVPPQKQSQSGIQITTTNNKSALAQHPLLDTLSSRTERVRAQRDDSRIKRRDSPLLVLSTKRERGSDEGSYINSIGAEISVPFGSRSFAAPRLAQAEAALTEVKVQQLSAKRNILLQQKQALQQLEKTETQLKLATKSNQVAQQRLKLAQRGFDLGETELYQLLLAREQADKTGIELEKIQIERQRAINRYNHSHGVIPQ